MFSKFLENLRSEWLTGAVNLIVYAAILALFVVCFIKCVAPVWHMRGLLSRASRAIRKGDGAKRSWQEEDFLGRGALKPHWREYLNNLFFADGEFHNPSNVEDFINEDTVIYGPGRSTLSEAAPGLMVSLGFLGTLIGMTTGLSGFSMDNADKVMEGIQRLIPGMQYAFTTSIVGVTASIVFTLLTRIVNGTALRALNGFYNAMSQYAGVVSVEPMTQIAIYQQEQTALIQHMAEDMAGSMSRRMGDAMADALSRAIDPLTRSIEDFVNYTSREQVRGVEGLVNRFVRSMDDALGGQMHNLASTIDGICADQREMQSAMRQAVDGMVRMSGDITQVQKISESLIRHFDDYMSRLSGTQQQAEEGYSRIAANVERLEIIARQQNEYLQSISKLQGEVGRSLESFQGAGEAMSRAAAEIKRSGETLASSHQALASGVTKDIDKAYNTFFENVNKTTDQLHWLVEDVKETLGKLPDLLDGTAGLYANQADRLTDALRRAQAALDDAVDRMSGGGYGR